MGTDGKFSHVSLRTNQKLQETFRLSPSLPKFPEFLFATFSSGTYRAALLQTHEPELLLTAWRVGDP